MKKMAIVPFKMLEEMNRWKTEQRPRLPPPPQVSQTSDLQKQMGDVLQNESLSESEKAQHYGQVLQRFQLSHQKAREPATLAAPVAPAAPVVPAAQGAQGAQAAPATLTDRILESVPTTMRRKTQLLLHFLQNHPHMSWNDQGMLEYHGKPIQGSNIIDLVNDVIRHRKGSEPRGWEQFSSGLRDVNVPQEVIGNKRRWSWMQKADDSEEDDEFDSFVESRSPISKRMKAEPISKPVKQMKAEPKWEAY